MRLTLTCLPAAALQVDDRWLPVVGLRWPVLRLGTSDTVVTAKFERARFGVGVDPLLAPLMFADGDDRPMNWRVDDRVAWVIASEDRQRLYALTLAEGQPLNLFLHGFREAEEMLADHADLEAVVFQVGLAAQVALDVQRPVDPAP